MTRPIRRPPTMCFTMSPNEPLNASVASTYAMPTPPPDGSGTGPPLTRGRGRAHQRHGAHQPVGRRPHAQQRAPGGGRSRARWRGPPARPARHRVDGGARGGGGEGRGCAGANVARVGAQRLRRGRVQLARAGRLQHDLRRRRQAHHHRGGSAQPATAGRRAVRVQRLAPAVRSGRGGPWTTRPCSGWRSKTPPWRSTRRRPQRTGARSPSSASGTASCPLPTPKRVAWGRLVRAASCATSARASTGRSRPCRRVGTCACSGTRVSW